MVYCQKCGKRNDDDAKFCNKCGTDLLSPRRARGYDRDYERRHEDRCEEECSGKRHTAAWSNFWMIILALIAIGIVLSLMIRLFGGSLPAWFHRFEFWDVIPLLIGLVIVMFIIYMISQPRHRD